MDCAGQPNERPREPARRSSPERLHAGDRLRQRPRSLKPHPLSHHGAEIFGHRATRSLCVMGQLRHYSRIGPKRDVPVLNLTPVIHFSLPTMRGSSVAHSCHKVNFCFRFVLAESPWRLHPASMSSKRLDTLADYARHGYKLRVDCGCGRVVMCDPHNLLAVISAKGWTRYSMERLAMRLRCQECGSRPRRTGPGLGS